MNYSLSFINDSEIPPNCTWLIRCDLKIHLTLNNLYFLNEPIYFLESPGVNHRSRPLAINRSNGPMRRSARWFSVTRFDYKGA